jgi:hypothetical protein
VEAKLLAMNWLGPGKRIEVVEQGDVLVVKATGIRRAVDLLLPLAACGWAYFVWTDRDWVSSVVSLFIFSLFVWLFRSKDGELRISGTDIMASGDRGGWTKGPVQFSLGRY